MKTITLATKNGHQEIQAYPTKSPNLFIHRSIDGGKLWTISHVPSGWKILGSIYTLKNAKQACEILAQITEWSELKPSEARNFFWKHEEILLQGKDAAYKSHPGL